MEGVASVVNRRELPDRSAELRNEEKESKAKKGVGEHPRSVRILNVCWLTGRSLRARRSVRPRKGDSREISGIENA